MRSTVFVIDTNVILRYLLADHPEQFEKVRAFMEEVKTGTRRVLIPESVLAECVYVLLKVYEVPREEIAEKLIGILRYRGVVNSDREVLIRALTLFGSKSVDIVDAIVSAIGSGERLQVFSFDRDLEKLR